MNRAVSGEDRAVVERPERLFEAVPRLAGNRILSRLDGCHVHADRAIDHDAELSGSSRQVGRIGAGHHRLGGNAAGIHAGAAKQMALDDRDPHAGRRQAPGEWRPGLAGADDDGVEGLAHLPFLFSECRAGIIRRREAPWQSRRAPIIIFYFGTFVNQWP